MITDTVLHHAQRIPISCAAARFLLSRNLEFLAGCDEDRRMYRSEYQKRQADPAKLEKLNLFWVRIILAQLGMKKFGEKFGSYAEWSRQCMHLEQALNLLLNLRGPKMRITRRTRTKVCPLCRHLAHLERVNGGLNDTDVDLAQEYYGECTCAHRSEVRMMSAWAFHAAQHDVPDFWERKVELIKS